MAFTETWEKYRVIRTEQGLQPPASPLHLQ